MRYFQCDYAEGCHPRLMERLAETNLEQTVGYGCDPHCDHARALIREACACPGADVHFLVGGTQVNTLAVAACLRPYQGVLTAQTGHIAVHETGAIEATGHKVLAISTGDGKLTAALVEEAHRAHFSQGNREHTVQPGMVYISLPTEGGALYTKAELEVLSGACRRLGLPLYIDGARLGYGLTSPANDLTLPDLARLADLFTIGGTKCGALFGEALVIPDPAWQADFRYHIKQRGGMLAKGRLLGVQFETLFTDDLYFAICRQANVYATAIREAFASVGVSPAMESYTNQQFFVLDPAQLKQLEGKYLWDLWEELPDGRSLVRFCTSWATTAEAVKQLTEDIRGLTRG